MRKDYHKLPEEIREHGYDFHWDNEKVWALDIPVQEISVSELEWIFDFPFWSYDGGKYNLTPRKVIENIDLYPEHKDRVLGADISHPIDTMENQNGKLQILDGLHRLVRLVLEGNKVVKVRKIPRKVIPLIEK